MKKVKSFKGWGIYQNNAKEIAGSDILEDLYLQYEDMEIALKKYCELFAYEVKSKPKK